tara:strand:- start:291 stop:458 length:168 start_codon:yes stop_codon:yes gene_type:complete
MKTLLLLTFLLVLLYRRFKSFVSSSSESDVVSQKEKSTKVDYSKVRDADFEDLGD